MVYMQPANKTYRARAGLLRAVLLLLVLLACTSGMVAAGAEHAQSDPEGIAAEDVAAWLEREWVYADTGRFLESILDFFQGEGLPHGLELHIGDWYLHPKGISLCIPQGLTLVGRYKGVDIMLVDDDGAEAAQAFRTNISVVIQDRDDDLFELTDRKITSAYSSQFHRFRLQSMQQIDMFDEECLRISFVYNEVPEIFAQQYLFNKGDKSYIMTLTTENRLECVAQGLMRFRAFTDSIDFLPSEH